MFIRETKRKYKNSNKLYYTHKLVESIRTPDGPRQRVVLNLGTLELSKDKWTELAQRIEELISGQKRLLPCATEIESLAQHYNKLYVRQQLANTNDIDKREHDFQSVDVNALRSSEAKSIGKEHLAFQTLQKLGLIDLFERLEFTQNQINMAVLSVIGRLIHPSSEHELKRYAKEDSALDELLGTDFSRISQNALYEVSDLLLLHKQTIEQFLRTNTKKLLGLSESIILYDLTNTYFEGGALLCEEAENGRSKDKRNDRPQITVGLVLDGDGFLKLSQTFRGNVSEPSTMVEIIESLHRKAQGTNPPLPLDPPTVVMDAGIASEDNLNILKERGFCYIVVSRSRPKDIPKQDFTQIKKGVHAHSFQRGEETFLHCWSEAKTNKEQAIVQKMRIKMEAELTKLRDGLSIKGRLKNYDKVLERIGKLRKQYTRVSKGFTINVQQEGKNAVHITWSFDEKSLGKPYDGTYFLRTNRTDLTDERLWKTYIMLNTVEDGFRCLKSELGLRPNFHQKGERIKGHIFITILAYHLLHMIQYHLHQAGIHHRWSTIRSWLGTHCILTTSLPREQGGLVHVRHCTTATLHQSEVYSALGIRSVPLKPRKTITQ
jgi:transposase